MVSHHGSRAGSRAGSVCGSRAGVSPSSSKGGLTKDVVKKHVLKEKHQGKVLFACKDCGAGVTKHTKYKLTKQCKRCGSGRAKALRFKSKMPKTVPIV